MLAGLARLLAEVERDGTRTFWTTRKGVRIGIQVDEVGGRLLISRLTLEPAGHEVNSAALRELALGELLAEVRRYLAPGPRVYVDVADPNVISGDVTPEAKALMRRLAAAAQQVPQRGRSGYSDDFYRRVAVAYLNFLAATPPVTRGILAAIADLAIEQQWFDDGRPVPTETVRSWVLQARKRGFLSGGEKGRAGAQPGPRLYDDDRE